MLVTPISLALAIGKVIIVGSVSMLGNTLISYHHHHKAGKFQSSMGGGKKNDRKIQSPSERMQGLRRLQESE